MTSLGGAVAAGGIFLSYRRADSGGSTGRIYDRLVDVFGEDAIFMDVDSLEPGEDYGEVIERTIPKLAVVVVVIGPKWLAAEDRHGRRRLDSEDDLLAIEVATALEARMRLLPVLVDGATMPDAEDLPERLRPMTRRTAVSITQQGFDRDAQVLIERLRRIIEPVLGADLAPAALVERVRDSRAAIEEPAPAGRERPPAVDPVARVPVAGPWAALLTEEGVVLVMAATEGAVEVRSVSGSRPGRVVDRTRLGGEVGSVIVSTGGEGAVALVDGQIRTAIVKPSGKLQWLGVRQPMPPTGTGLAAATIRGEQWTVWYRTAAGFGSMRFDSFGAAAESGAGTAQVDDPRLTIAGSGQHPDGVPSWVALDTAAVSGQTMTAWLSLDDDQSVVRLVRRGADGQEVRVLRVVDRLETVIVARPAAGRHPLGFVLGRSGTDLLVWSWDQATPEA